MHTKSLILGLLSAVAVSCVHRGDNQHEVIGQHARYFKIIDSAVVSISPYDGSSDTLYVSKPLKSIVCMSTSYVACLHEIGADTTVTGVSGLRYLSNPVVRERAAEVGYEAAPDYERIIAIAPDVVAAYSVSSKVPQYITKLQSLGTKVFLLYEHLETDPLARAEYIRLFGAMTGRQDVADSVFSAIEKRYYELSSSVSTSGGQPCKVLMNIPYGDQWYIPGGDSYMSKLVSDAGGEILGAVEGKAESSVISVETAYALSQEADIWLHPGTCTSREQIRSAHPLFTDFPVIDRKVYNNTLRSTPGGGNDFWESGAVRPDLVLEDLVNVFHPGDTLRENLHYYIEVK